MKDYSEFIKEEHGFITSIKPNLETKTIEVMTSMSKKGEPHVYTLTKENIQRLYTRLEKQYKLLIENKDSILNQLESKREKKLKIADFASVGVSIALLLTAFFAPELNFLFIVSPIPTIGAFTSTFISKSKFRKDFNDMIETYNYFITNKEEIESLAKTDENVTKVITVDSYQKLKKSEKLVNEKLTDEQYTIQLIDNLSLKDLKEISLRFKISKALATDPYFHIEQPEEIIGEPVIDEIPDEEMVCGFDEEYEVPEILQECMTPEELQKLEQTGFSKTLHK